MSSSRIFSNTVLNLARRAAFASVADMLKFDMGLCEVMIWVVVVVVGKRVMAGGKRVVKVAGIG